MVNHYTKQLSHILSTEEEQQIACLDSIKFKMKINSVHQRMPPVFFGYFAIFLLISLFWIENFIERVNFLILVVIDLIVNSIVGRLVLKSKDLNHLKSLEIGYLAKTMANAMVRLTMQIYLGREVPIWLLNLYALLTLTHTSYFKKKILIYNFMVIFVSNMMGQYLAFENGLKLLERGGKFFTLTHEEMQTPYLFQHIWDSNRDRLIKLLEPIISFSIAIFIGFVYEDIVEQQYDETIRSRIALYNQKEMNKSKTKFISNLSHELRNPLHGLLVTVELMQIEMKKISQSLQNLLNSKVESFENLVNQLQNDLKSQLELLNDIESNSKILMDVFSNYLQISKMELGKIKLNHVPFNILELTDSITSVFTNLANEKGLILQSIVDFKIPLYLVGDQVRLSQIFLNLVSNSVKYTQKGNVILKCTQSHPSDEDYPFQDQIDSEKSVCLKVTCQDTGIGILPKDIRNLFKPFNTVDGASMDFEKYYANSNIKQSGSSFHESHGIGLSLSNQFIELMNGKIKVEREIGIGTRVTLYIPLRRCSTCQIEKFDSNILQKIEEIEKFTINQILILQENENLAYLIEKLCKSIYPNVKLQKISDMKSLKDTFGNIQKLFESTTIPQSKNLVFYPSNSTLFTTESLQPLLPNSLLISTNLRTSNQFSKSDICLPTRIEHFISTIHSKISSNTSKTIPKSISLPIFHSKKVLVVDDNQINRKVLHKMTKILGFSSQEASNGLEAFEIFKKQRDFDLILLDLLMPILCGKECCKLIRSIEKERKCKIVAVTANVWESEESLLESGFDLVLKKPILMKDLQKQLEKLMKS